MDLRRLEIFAKVAELGSFSRAAEALFLTQPTISEHTHRDRSRSPLAQAFMDFVESQLPERASK